MKNIGKKIAEWVARLLGARPVYGLIEWDGSLTPTLIVGKTVNDVKRRAFRILIRAGVPGCSDADADFEADCPAPVDDTDTAAVNEWLEDFREAATVPWFSILDDEDIARV